MLALTILIALLIVVPNGRWRDLVRPVAPALAEIGQGDADQVADGADLAGGETDKPPRLVLPGDLPALPPEEEPGAETIPLRIGF